MKKFLMVAMMSGVLAACSSEPTKEQEPAPVTDQKGEDVNRAPVKPVAPSATGVKGNDALGAELKDPNNILSKRSVYFDYDSNLVKDEFKPLVTAHAHYLQQHPTAKMRIEGNADDRGSREYNLALGQRRADAVKQMMQLLGAKPEQVETVSFGEEKPKCSEAAESCWSQNRRGDITYQGE